LYALSPYIISLLNNHCIGELINAANGYDVTGLSNKRCMDIMGDGLKGIFIAVCKPWFMAVSSGNNLFND
jgi:hypothetical protein